MFISLNCCFGGVSFEVMSVFHFNILNDVPQSERILSQKYSINGFKTTHQSAAKKKKRNA